MVKKGSDINPRILVLITRFYPVLGGMERQCQSIMSELIARDWQCQILTYRPTSDETETAVIDNIPINRFGKGTWAPRDIYVAYWQMFRFMLQKKHTYDLIQVFGDGHLAMMSIAVSKIVKKPVVIRTASYLDVTNYVQGKPVPGQHWLGKLYDQDPLEIKRHFLRQTAAWIAQSSQIKQELIGLNMSANRVHQIGNSVDLTRFYPPSSDQKKSLRNQYNIPLTDIVFIFVGRFVKLKGVFDLLEAWQLVTSEYQNIHLILVGSSKFQNDSIEANIQQKADSLPNIHLPGQIEDPVPYYQVADIVVLPSHHEGLPNVLLEGMACGLAAIATKLGGVADIITGGKDGVLVKPAYPEQLADSMKQLIMQPDLLAQLGATAQVTIENKFSMEKIITAYQSVYHHCLNEK